QPSEYMQTVYSQILAEQRTAPAGGERHPEVCSERVWEAIIKRLFQKDYKFDAGFFGSLSESSRKVAYFFHASLQGTACYEGAAAAMRHVHDAGLAQGLLGDGQCFTHVQLQRGLHPQDESANLDELLTENLTVLSCGVGARKPSERLFRRALEALAEQGIGPDEVLHVGSRVQNDRVPAGRRGMKTALFAGDKASLQATPEQLKANRPDALLTSLEQIQDII